MTTIAADRKGMASDSQYIFGDLRSDLSAKKIFRIKGSLVGVAGSCAQTWRVINTLQQAKENPVEYLTTNTSLTHDGINILILNKKGLWGYDGHGAVYPINEKHSAVGSGYIIAHAVLLCGKTVQEAVRIAIKLDTKSGGRMKYVKL